MDKSEELPFFMICILNREKFNHIEGFYSDPECHNVDEFDKKFPFKIKERKEGQLE